MTGERELEIQLVLEPFFANLFPEDQAKAHVAELARRIAPRLAALDRELLDLARDRGRLERDLSAERRATHALSLRCSKTEDTLEHVRWVGGMTLGIAEGTPGWGLVKEYEPGHPKAEGSLAIRAVKQLRRNLEASLERESRLMAQLEREKTDHAAARHAFTVLSASADAARQELEQLKAGVEPEDLSEPEALPCPLYPDEAMQVCPDALRKAPESFNGERCTSADSCHQVLSEKIPALLEIHASARRVAAPA
jgi:hypothetical protein